MSEKGGSKAGRATQNIARGLGQIVRWADEQGDAPHYEEGIGLLSAGIEEALEVLSDSDAD